MIIAQSPKSVRLILILTVLIANVFVAGLLTYSLSQAKLAREREVRAKIENLVLLLDHNIT